MWYAFFFVRFRYDFQIRRHLTIFQSMMHFQEDHKVLLVDFRSWCCQRWGCSRTTAALVVQFAQSQAVNGTYWIWKSPLSPAAESLRWRYCHRPVSVINLIEGLCATWHLLVPPQFSVTQLHNVFLDLKKGSNQSTARCLKITEVVSFKIASEASYIYILIGQKWIKKAKNGPFWRVFENLKLAVKQCYRQVNFNRRKIGGKCQSWKTQMRHFE